MTYLQLLEIWECFSMFDLSSVVYSLNEVKGRIAAEIYNYEDFKFGDFIVLINLLSTFDDEAIEYV